MLPNHELKRQRRAAFTLLEMLVVVAIIVALAGIGGFFLLGQLEGAKKSNARTNIKGNLTPACETFFVNHGSFPESLQQLTTKDDMGNPPILKSADYLLDPWSKPYIYDKAGTKNNGMAPDIYTTAPDGEVIGNWPKGR